MIGLSDIVNVAELATGVLDRVWPKKMTEEEKAQAAREFRRVLMEEKSQEIEDVISARALAMKEAENAPYSVRLARGLFRPFAGYICVTLWAGTVGVRFCAALQSWKAAGFSVAGAPDLAGLLTAWDFGVIMLVLGFFFGTRSFEKSRGVQNRG